MPRPRQSTEQLEAKGAFAKNPNRKRLHEPQAPPGELIKPKYLKGLPSRIWDEYAPICAGMGTLKHGDEAEFATWCKLEAESRKAFERMPTSRIAQKRAYAERFGIAGAGSRAKLSTDGDKAEDPAEQYFVTAGPGNTLRQ